MISGAMIRLFTGFLACLTISFSNFRSPSPTKLIDLKEQIFLGFLPGMKTDYPGLPNRPHCQMVSNTVNTVASSLHGDKINSGLPARKSSPRSPTNTMNILFNGVWHRIIDHLESKHKNKNYQIQTSF
jgi:hypothetical protein